MAKTEKDKALSESKASRKSNDGNISDEIDSLFIRAASEKSTPSKDSKKSSEAKKKEITAADDRFFDTRGRKASKRKYTAEGLPIYTAEEMGIRERDKSGKDGFHHSGASSLCPFDCQCCF